MIKFVYACGQLLAISFVSCCSMRRFNVMLPPPRYGCFIACFQNFEWLGSDMSGKSRGCYALSDINQILPPVGVSFGHRQICHISRLSRSTRERFSSSRECISPQWKSNLIPKVSLSLVESASEYPTKFLLSMKG